MITFKYSDPTGHVSLDFRCRSEHLDGIVQDFKVFLLHVGHHPNNIEHITFEERQQGLPTQLALFPETAE